MKNLTKQEFEYLTANRHMNLIPQHALIQHCEDNNISIEYDKGEYKFSGPEFESFHEADQELQRLLGYIKTLDVGIEEIHLNRVPVNQVMVYGYEVIILA